jgi:hypothetical protein
MPAHGIFVPRYSLIVALSPQTNLVSEFASQK